MFHYYKNKRLKPNAPNEPPLVIPPQPLIAPYRLYSLIRNRYNPKDWLAYLSFARRRPTGIGTYNLTPKGYCSFLEPGVQSWVDPVFSPRDCYNTIFRTNHISVKLELGKREEMQTDTLWDAFKRMKRLRSVYLTVEGVNYFYTGDVNTKFFCDIGRALKELRGIQTLTLGDIRGKYREETPRIQTIFYALRTMRTLVNSRIFGSNHDSPKLDTLFCLRKTFSHLESATLHFTPKLKNLSKEMIPAIFLGLQTVKKLNISIQDDEILTQSILAGIANLGGINCILENFSISLNRKPEKEDIQAFQKFSNMATLKSLEITFYYFGFNTNTFSSSDFILLQLLSELPNLTFFKYRFGISTITYENELFSVTMFLNPVVMEELAKSIKGLSKVKKIAITHSSRDTHVISEHGIPVFLAVIPEFPWVESFTYESKSLFNLEFTSHKIVDLKIVSFSDYDNEFINSLFLAIEKNTKLEEFKLDIIACHKPIEEKLKSLSNTFKALTSLNSIDLDLRNSNKLTNKEMEILAEGLEPLNLKKLILRIDDASNKLTATGIDSISECLHKKTELKELIFSFLRCPKVADYAVFYILNGGLEQWKSLENADINCYNGCSVKFSKFQKLQVKFNSCSSLTLDGMTNLRETINQLPKLTQLDLLFGDSPSASDPAIKELFKTPEKKSELEEFRFSVVGNSKFGTQSILSISEFLKGISPEKLTTFFFDIKSPGKIDAGAFDNLVTKMNDFGNLQTLYLNFSGIKTLSDKEIGAFSRILGERMTGLKNVKLIFGQCIGITDVGAKPLAGACKLLPNIEDFEFVMEDNPKITGAVVKEIVEACEGMVGLKAAILKFWNCTKIKDGDLKAKRDFDDKLKIKVEKMKAELNKDKMDIEIKKF